MKPNPIDPGGGIVGIPVAAHPFLAGQIIAISGTPGGVYDKHYEVLSTTTPTSIHIKETATGGKQNLDAAAAVNPGGGEVDIPLTGHGYNAGDRVVFSGTVNYNNTYTVVAGTRANFIRITETFSAETFTGTETAQRKFSGTEEIHLQRSYNVYTLDNAAAAAESNGRVFHFTKPTCIQNRSMDFPKRFSRSSL